jgi:dihydrofolate reductase
VARLRATPGRDVIVPGSPRLVRALLAEGLLDELALMVHPLAVGVGERLFDGLSDLRLELVGSRTFGTGVVSLTYKPIKG